MKPASPLPAPFDIHEYARQLIAPLTPRMCKSQGCKNEAHYGDWCRECDDRQFEHEPDTDL